MAFNPSKYTRRGSSPSRGPSRGPTASMDAARAAARAGNMGAPRATQAGGQAPSERNPGLQNASARMDAARARQQSRTGERPTMNPRMMEAIKARQAGGAPGGPSTMNPGMMEAIKARQAGGMPPPGGTPGRFPLPPEDPRMVELPNPGMGQQRGGLSRLLAKAAPGGTPGGPSTTNTGGGGMMNMQMPGFRGQVGGTPGGPSTMTPGGAPGGAPGPAPMMFKKGGKTKPSKTEASKTKKAPSGSKSKGYGMARGGKVCKIR